MFPSQLFGRFCRKRIASGNARTAFHNRSDWRAPHESAQSGGDEGLSGYENEVSEVLPLVFQIDNQPPTKIIYSLTISFNLNTAHTNKVKPSVLYQKARVSIIEEMLCPHMLVLEDQHRGDVVSAYATRRPLLQRHHEFGTLHR